MTTTPVTKFTSYALLGSGRVAKHFRFYLEQLNLPVKFWSRREPADLASVVRDSSHVLFAVKDEAIGELSSPFLDSGKTLVHFSGALQIHGVHAAHPLMSFSETPHTGLHWYKEIPFVLDEGTTLSDLLPGLPNPSWKLPSHERPLYHALCSLAGNGSFLLWENIAEQFEQKLRLPRRVLAPFLHQVVDNFVKREAGGFTGPVARGDWQTVRQHLSSLQPELLSAYRSYLKLANESGHPVPEGLL